MEHWKQWNTGVMSFKSFQFNVLTIRFGVKPFERFGNGKETSVLFYTTQDYFIPIGRVYTENWVNTRV